MNAGYVRLSRDDDKKNYISIENQKLIIRQYAAEHGVQEVDALEKGMAEKSKEFTEKGSEIYL